MAKKNYLGFQRALVYSGCIYQVTVLVIKAENFKNVYSFKNNNNKPITC